MAPLERKLVSPSRLWSRDEILSADCPAPRQPGVYAWYFRQIPSGVPVDGCRAFDGKTLLYVGISPAAPPKSGAPASRETLRSRLRYHYRGNAKGSTLRLTLGCLLSQRLGIQLRRVGSDARMTFTAQGEEKLSRWMGENAFLTWLAVGEPWILEDRLIRTLSVPLNLRGNERHPFHPALSEIRRKAKERARRLPAVTEKR